MNINNKGKGRVPFYFGKIQHILLHNVMNLYLKAFMNKANSMKNRYMLFLMIVGSYLCFFTSCNQESKELNNLLGIWNYVQITATSCDNSNDNEVVDYSGEGYCQDISGVNICTKLALEINDNTYTIRATTNSNGVENMAIVEEGTYSILPQSPLTISFCTDLVCRSEIYIVDGNTLTLTSEDINTGCDTVTRTEKN